MHDYIRQSFIREAQTHFKQHWSINTPKLDLLSRTVTNNSLGGWGVGGRGVGLEGSETGGGRDMANHSLLLNHHMNKLTQSSLCVSYAMSF